MKTFLRCVAGILFVLLVIVAVIGMVNLPIETETESPAITWLRIIQKNINSILTGLGISSSALLLYLGTVISKQTKTTATSSDSTTQKVEQLEKENSELKAIINNQTQTINNQTTQIKSIGDMLSTVFLMSDLPVSVREKITAYKENFENAGVTKAETQTQQPQQTAEQPKETKAENKNTSSVETLRFL